MDRWTTLGTSLQSNVSSDRYDNESFDKEQVQDEEEQNEQDEETEQDHQILPPEYYIFTIPTGYDTLIAIHRRTVTTT